jgi:proteasome lid subunit RPN8/RPN11
VAAGPIEVSPGLAAVEIPAAVLNEICAHARAAYPDQECCGLVTGDDRERYRRVWPCRNQQNRYHRSDPVGYPHDARTAFLIDPEDARCVEEEARTDGERVTVVYHSHLDCGAYFSEHDQHCADREQFRFPDADHLVVSVIGHRDASGRVKEHRVGEIALFRRSSASDRFEGAPVRPAPP